MIPINADDILRMTNQTRQELRLPPVQFNDTLNQAALRRATDMATQGYFSHNSPTGKNAWPFIQESGYAYNSAGENLGIDFTDTGKLYNAWASSPTHKANLTNNKYKDMGVAIVPGKKDGRDTYYVVQLFGEPQPPKVVPKPVAKAAPKKKLPVPKPIQRKPLPSDKRYAFKR